MDHRVVRGGECQNTRTSFVSFAASARSNLVLPTSLSHQHNFIFIYNLSELVTTTYNRFNVFSVALTWPERMPYIISHIFSLLYSAIADDL